MWLIPCASRTSSARSATSWLTRPSAAPPKIIRVLSCPVRPKGMVGMLMPLSIPESRRLGGPVLPGQAGYAHKRAAVGGDERRAEADGVGGDKHVAVADWGAGAFERSAQVAGDLGILRLEWQHRDASGQEELEALRVLDRAFAPSDAEPELEQRNRRESNRRAGQERTPEPATDLDRAPPHERDGCVGVEEVNQGRGVPLARAAGPAGSRARCPCTYPA